MEAVGNHLCEDTASYDFMYPATEEQLSEIIEAKLDSDIHVPSTVVTEELEGWTILIARAVEETMTGEFAESNEQIAGISVIDPAVKAAEVVPDVRPKRAFALSAILSCFFAIVVLLLKELGDNGIWLPATMRRRYGLTAVGTIHSAECKTNLEYLFAGKRKIAVCAIEEDVNPIEAADRLREIMISEGESASGDDAKRKQTNDRIEEWIPLPAPLLCSEACEIMREADGVLLLVRAGSHAGKPLEYILEYLMTQGIEVNGALLWDADEWLIRVYYLFP